MRGLRNGNTSASSLLTCVSSAQGKAQTLNDSLAGYNYELSPKDDAAFGAYSSYLQNRIGASQNDPTKSLSYEKALTGAHKSYTSASITRASTQVDYGNIDNPQKYEVISHLRDAALQNGDEATAQSLEAKMAGLSMTIQNQQAAAEAKATAAGDKADREQEKAITKGASKAVGDKEDLINQLKGLKVAGKITPAQFDDRMGQLYLGNPETGAQGLLSIIQAAKEATGDPNSVYQDKLNKYGADKSVQGYINGNKEAQNAVGANFRQVMIKNPDGTYDFHARDNGQLDANSPSVQLHGADGKPVMDANGHAITVPNYKGPQAFTDKAGAVTGFQYATSIDPNTGLPTRTALPGKGPGALAQINKDQINNDDPSGVPYFYNEAGQKKFIGKDDKNGLPIMSNDPAIITGKFDYGKTGSSTSGLGQFLNSMVHGGKQITAAPQSTNPGDALAQFRQQRDASIAAKAKIDAVHAAAQQAAYKSVTAQANTPAATTAPAIGASIMKVAGKPAAYLPSTPANPSPTQNYNTAASQYKDPMSQPAVASGIAAAVGYNPFPKF